MFKRLWPVLLLLCVSVGIVFVNVQKGTWLIGWDSTQPELNWSLNLSRGLSAVWQEYRGLGVTDGMAHSANLIHIAYAWILANIVGTNYVRYAFTLLSHLLGGVGMYTLLRYLGRSLRGEKVSRLFALAGAIFYMLNPFTLQMFYQPLEVFVTHYVALPWLTFTLIQYVRTPNRRNLWWFTLANILTLPQAHVPTLFIVWIMLASCLLAPILLLRGKRYGKQILVIVLVTIGINGFWGLPYIYSAINNAKNIGEAKINVLSNSEVILRNDAYGDLNSIVRMQGFSLEYEDWNEGYKYGLQMPEWASWWEQAWVIWMMGAVLLIAGVGLVGIVVERRWWMGGVGLMYLVALGNLGARIPYVGVIGTLLREYIPYYEAIFRFTFTKFALVYALTLTILVVIGILRLSRIWQGWVSGVVAVLWVGGTIVVTWPVWQGQFFYHNLKLKVPSEYQRVFEFFDGHNEGRVLPLPYSDFWGWQSNEWEYRGSGFVWQGIPNPTVYGSFNAWSPYNETFYNEFSSAFYNIPTSQQTNESTERVNSVLQKYDVRYVLLDESVIAPGQDKKILRIEETKRLASELGWKEAFHDGFLTVWDRGEQAGLEYVSAPRTYVMADGDTLKTRQDVMYAETGSYVSGNGGVVYPFAELTREEMKNIEYADDGLQLTANGIQLGQELVVPGWESGEWVELGYSVMWKDGKVKIDWDPVYRVGKILEEKLEVFDDWRGPSLPTLTYPIKIAQDSIWVQIEGSEAIYLHDGEQGRGRAKLQVGRPVATTVFAGQGKEQVTQVGEEQPCGAQGELRCWATPLTKATTNSLVQTITHYEGTASPEVCWDLEGEQYECVNMTKRGVSPIVIAHPVGVGERYWVDWVVRDSAIKMQALGVVEYPLLGRNEMGGEWWGEFLHERSYKTAEEPIVVSVAGRERTYELAKLGKSAIESCDVLKRGTADKQGNTYIADERGAACDHVEMTELDTRLPYLMRIKGENKEGRSVKFFLWNTGSQRNDLESLLGKNQFDQTFALLPWNFGGSYSLNIETRSFGERAENMIEPVEVRYFPLKQLAGARVGEVNQVHNQLTVRSVQKVGTWLYRVKVEGNGVIRLSQGYDQGWVGWGARHVKVDGWANGWMVEKDNRTGRDSDQSIVLFYWPQLLEYLGFLIMGVTVIGVWRGKTKLDQKNTV